MSEVPKNYKPSDIPANWAFPGRNNPTLQVLQLDLKESLLVTNLPGNQGIEFHPEYKGHYGAYLLGPQGQQVEELTHMSHCTQFKRVGDGLSYIHISYQFPYVEDINFLILDVNSFPPNLAEQRLIPWHEAQASYQRRPSQEDPKTISAEQIRISERFMVPTGDRGGLIPSPGFTLTVKDILHNSSTLDWTEKNLEDLNLNNELYASRYGYDEGRGLFHGFAVKQDPRCPNSLFFQDKQNEIIYHTIWNIVDGETGDREIIIEEKHLPTGTTRLVKATLVIDTGKIASSYSMKLIPYPEGENSALEIPWEGLDRQVGFSVNYYTENTDN